MDRMSLVVMGGAPGSGEGVVPNSRLDNKLKGHCINLQSSGFHVSKGGAYFICIHMLSHTILIVGIELVSAEKRVEGMEHIPGNGIEALAEMGLDSLRVPGLREYLQELVVGEEVEPREEESLLLEVILQTFLDLLQETVVVLEGVQQTCVLTKG